ncbi:VOC family protein [Parasphingorhabdus sp.]|jgi:predicted enzyme related to lactoylglutathione lyase|uniref:VOC family protein n=1 Tax=Parasphingorhabdus sp. TaxID=2709688 RepID=UPI0039E661D5
MTDMAHDQLVWVEIPATDLNRAKAFYESVLEISLIENDDGPQKMHMIPSKGDSMCGHLYEGKPATSGDGPTPHFSTRSKLDDAMERIQAAGGEVVSEPIPLPAAAFFYAKDTEGNSIAIFKFND